MRKSSTWKSNGNRFSFSLMLIAGFTMLASSIFLYVNDLVGIGINLRYLQPVVKTAETSLLYSIIFFVIAYFFYVGRKNNTERLSDQNKKVNRRERRENERENK